MPNVPYQVGGNAAGCLNAKIPPTAARSGPVPFNTISVSEYVAVYTAQPSDPTWDVRLQGEGHVAFYRAPANIKVDVSTDWDAPLVVYDPAAAPTSELRCWRAVIDPKAHTITCEGWGLFDSSACGSGLPLHGWGTGCGLSYSCGLLRGWEVGAVVADRARIAHGLRIHGPMNRAFRLPARKSDQSRTTGPEMGSRWTLEATDAQIMERTVPNGDQALTRFLHAICFAARDFGLLAVDGNDDGFLLNIEHRVTAPQIGALADRSPTKYLSYALRSVQGKALIGFPFGQLRLLTPGVF